MARSARPAPGADPLGGPPLDPRLLARFTAAYRGGRPPDAALWWVLHPRRPTPGGLPAPAVELDERRRRLFRPGATDEEVAGYRRLEVEVRAEDRLAEAAYAVSSGSAGGRTGRPRIRAGGAVVADVLVAALVVALLVGVQPARTVGTRSPVLRQGPVAVGRPLALVGTPAQAAALRRAIRGPTEGPDALVTATAIRRVPVLRAADRLSESDVTATGAARLTLPDLDEFRTQTSATVLVFCVSDAAYTWTLRGTVGAGADARRWLQRGRGDRCGTLSSATVRLPADLHETELSAQVGGRTRFLLMLQTVG